MTTAEATDAEELRQETLKKDDARIEHEQEAGRGPNAGSSPPAS
jgi:hypothetical protein